MSICASLIPTREWIYTYVAQPVLEGGERLKRAFHGIDFHLFSRPRIGIFDRISYGLIGFVLIIPLLNTITWIFMQTFGEPEHLTFTSFSQF
jgi:hypothetical protein